MPAMLGDVAFRELPNNIRFGRSLVPKTISIDPPRLYRLPHHPDDRIIAAAALQFVAVLDIESFIRLDAKVGIASVPLGTVVRRAINIDRSRIIVTEIEVVATTGRDLHPAFARPSKLITRPVSDGSIDHRP